MLRLAICGFGNWAEDQATITSMDDHGLRHGRDRGESSSSSIEIQNQWREYDARLQLVCLLA
jgi:hypothetical protein